MNDVSDSVRRVEADHLRRRLRRWQWVVTAILIAGTFVPMAFQNVQGPGIPIIGLVSLGIQIFTGAVYARLKGRSAWWGLVGMAGCIGLFVLFTLNKRCHRCAEKAGEAGIESCPSCGAPM